MSRKRTRGGLWLPGAPRLQLRRTREIEALQPSIRLAGVFTITQRDERGRVERRFSFPNLITNAGMNSFASAVAPGQLSTSALYVAVGSGNTLPAFTDTALVSEITRTSAQAVPDVTGVVTGGAPEYAFYRRSRRFAAGVGTGTWREIGLFDTTPGGQLFSRAIIVDANGQPFDFVKLPGAQVDVTWEGRMVIPGDVSFLAQVIGGTSYDLTVRPINVHQFTHGWGESTGVGVATWNMGGATGNNIRDDLKVISAVSQLMARDTVIDNSNALLGTPSAYVADSYQRDVSYQWPSAGAVTIGQLGLQMYSGGRGPFFQVRFAPALVKPDANSLILNWRHSWARA